MTDTLPPVSTRISELIARLAEVQEKMKNIEDQAAVLEERILEAQ